MWQGWINLVLGIWLIISGFLTGVQHPINLIVTGILAAVFGFWAYKMWQGILNGILGVWLIISGLISSLIVPVNFFVVGIIMGVLGVWCALTHPKEMTTRTA